MLLVTEVYAAGEAPIKGADGRAICRAVRSRGGVEAGVRRELEHIAEALRDVLRAGDVVVTMGAGPHRRRCAGTQERPEASWRMEAA